MTRRSASTLVASSPARKRALSPVVETPRRQSKRARSLGTTPASSNTTPKKSQYFEQDPDESEDETEADEENSGYNEGNTSAETSLAGSEEDEAEEDDYSEEERPSRKVTARKGGDSKAAKTSKGQELWRPGVKTGLGPGNQVLIKIPKARDAGKVPYADNTIHPNTFLFLRDLAENNDREWLKSTLSYL